MVYFTIGRETMAYNNHLHKKIRPGVVPDRIIGVLLDVKPLRNLPQRLAVPLGVSELSHQLSDAPDVKSGILGVVLATNSNVGFVAALSDFVNCQGLLLAVPDVPDDGRLTAGLPFALLRLGLVSSFVLLRLALGLALALASLLGTGLGLAGILRLALGLAGLLGTGLGLGLVSSFVGVTLQLDVLIVLQGIQQVRQKLALIFSQIQFRRVLSHLGHRVNLAVHLVCGPLARALESQIGEQLNQLCLRSLHHQSPRKVVSEINSSIQRYYRRP